MWSTQHTAETHLPASPIWAAIRGIHSGTIAASGGDTFVLTGPFAIGSELSVTPAGQDTFTSRITELIDGERYADETLFGGVTLTFRHTLTPLETGTRVTHELVIDGPDADQVGPELGPQISADFPAAMEGLLAAAASLADA